MEVINNGALSNEAVAICFAIVFLTLLIQVIIK